MPTHPPAPDQIDLPLRGDWRTAALPAAFVLAAVEMQRHWHGEVRWLHLGSVIVLAVTWLGILTGRRWAVRHADTAIDAALFLLMAGASALYFVADDPEGVTLAATLTFWAPLICVWWAISQHANPARLAANVVILFTTLLFFHPYSTRLFFEYAILATLLILAVRAALGNAAGPAAKSMALANDTSMRDRVTGVASPSYFEAELAHTAAVADRYRIPFALIACRAPDYFAHVAKYGDAAGHELLRAFAWTLADRVRIADTVCRWEDDRFFILLPNTTIANARQVAGKIALPVGAPLTQNGLAMACRCGVVEHQFGEDPMATFALADAALNQAQAIAQAD